MDPTQLIGLIANVPVVGAILVLILMRKIVPGWALDEQRAQFERQLAAHEAACQRERDAADQRLVDARKDLAAAADELRQTTPVLVRANDALTATQEVLREMLRRGAPHG